MKKCIEYIVFVVVLLVGRGEGGAASVSAESVSVSGRIAYRERTPGENFLQQYRDDPAFDYSVKPVAETGDWWQRLRWWLMQHIFGSYTHKDIVWLDLLLKVLAGLIVVFGIYKLVRSKFWLTAKSEPDFQKTMAPWIGEAWNELSYRQMLEQAVGVVRNNMQVSTRIDPATGRRIDRPEYPLDAVRETILNALVHRDYSIHTEGMPIRLTMYSDRLEVANPGGLYGRLTVDQTGEQNGKILSTLWLRQEDGTPLRGEIAVDGEIILTADFTSFSFYDTIENQE